METLAQPGEQQPKADASPKLSRISVNIDKALDRAVERHATDLDISKRQIVEEALRMWLEARAA